MSDFARLEKRIARRMSRAVLDFKMIEEGDRVLVALSGGKDSWALLHLLHRLKRVAPISFTVTAITLHPGFADFHPDAVHRYCEERGFPHVTEATPIQEILTAKETRLTDYCAFCARLRRGILYSFAKREGFNKIALGHHADDLIETLLMGEFFNGEVKSMPPILFADDGVNVVIRPLCYVFEEDLVRYADLSEFPIIRCGCPVGEAAPHKMRSYAKALIGRAEKEHPGVKASMLSSLKNIRHRYLMAGLLAGEPPPSDGEA